MIGGHGMGGAYSDIKPFGLFTFPHQREFCTDDDDNRQTDCSTPYICVQGNYFLVSMHAWHCLDPSGQLAAIVLDIQYCFSLVPRFCIIILQYVLKKLAIKYQHSPQESEATVRKVDLVLAPQCGV